MTQILRQTGVVGKFVEYFGAGVSNLPLADRATIGNMSPERRLRLPRRRGHARYLLTGREGQRIALVEVLQGELLWHDPEHDPTYTQVVELDSATSSPASPARAARKDRVPLSEAKRSFLGALETFGVDYGTSLDEQLAETFPASDPTIEQHPPRRRLEPTLCRSRCST